MNEEQIKEISTAEIVNGLKNVCDVIKASFTRGNGKSDMRMGIVKSLAYAIIRLERLENENAELHRLLPKPIMLRGYDVEHLELVAELMRQHDITPDDLKKCVDNFENALKLVMEVQAAKAIEVLSAHAPVPDGGKE